VCVCVCVLSVYGVCFKTQGARRQRSAAHSLKHSLAPSATPASTNPTAHQLSLSSSHSSHTQQGTAVLKGNFDPKALEMLMSTMQV
jgi:hypothetical protein